MKYQIIRSTKVVGGARTLKGAREIVKQIGGSIYKRVDQ